MLKWTAQIHFFKKGEHIDIEHTQVPSITKDLGTPTVDISSPNLEKRDP